MNCQRTDFHVLILCGTTIVGSMFAGRAVAQAPTTIQLPTFQFFTAQTTVNIPDRGSVAIAGGNTRGAAAWGNGAMTWPSQRATGISGGATSITAHATIHDFEAIDAALLRQTATPQPPPMPRSPVAPSLAQINQLRESERAARQRDMADYLSRAQTAEREQQLGAARIWYQMAARRADPAAQAQINDRLKALSASQSIRPVAAHAASARP
ncbi:MAG TPA: hypothetical protein VG713_11100 [Pirellulales bacterium]|nr:hypothetical protein [Pirellulales bacterium]